MKKFLVAISALVLMSCVGHVEPCLDKGQAARVLSIQKWDSEGHHFTYVDLKLTTDNKTVRICRAQVKDVDQLVVGDVITGYDHDYDAGVGYDWFRVR